ncbi:MAG TPA: hypothetical protein VIX41_11170 [Acidimicrobiales bacterium]
MTTTHKIRAEQALRWARQSTPDGVGVGTIYALLAIYELLAEEWALDHSPATQPSDDLSDIEPEHFESVRSKATP